MSVGEAAKLLGVAPSTLRYYESAGLLTALARTDGGQRLFSDVDIEACRVIECLKMSGLSIKEIKAFMDMVAAGDESLEGRLALFEARRDALKREMAEMQSVLDVLEFKCWYYGTAVAAGTEDAVRGLSEEDIPAEHRAGCARLKGMHGE
ncbi:MAG: MerR family transcriptional regulator [Coriobacteriaceae bacterium]|nr:MerR family transcriptional regulator [Coriobacteriaceae bacterium]